MLPEAQKAGNPYDQPGVSESRGTERGKGTEGLERGEDKEGEMGRESVLVFRGHTGMSLI